MNSQVRIRQPAGASLDRPVRKQNRGLRSGFTTGACAAAAAKGALLALLTGSSPEGVEIPFPDGSRHYFSLHSCQTMQGNKARAAVVKDAGDDPDVTNGAVIQVDISFIAQDRPGGHNCLKGEHEEVSLSFRAGPGVGRVTRPGLAVEVGEPAINPGPRAMIKEAVMEALAETGIQAAGFELVVEISIPGGEALASKTLNQRLGIVGGLSILGTTGIVRPVSAKAWTDTIDVSISVAKQCGCRRILLSTGRTSERVVQDRLALPDEALVMMGDHLAHAVKAAGQAGFEEIHLAGMWAKVVKAALRIPQTHVRHGALRVQDLVDLLSRAGLTNSLASRLLEANTARHILEILQETGRDDLVEYVCREAKAFASSLAGRAVTIWLVGSDKRILVQV